MQEEAQAQQAQQTQTDPSSDAATTPEQRSTDQTVAAVADWLAARWMPAPPWTPDPAWLESELPDPPMPPASFSVISSLLQAQQACQDVLGADPAQPDQVKKLARIVNTLNRRASELEQVAADPTPWEQVAALNDQADAVRSAVTQGVFQNQEKQAAADEPLAPWRPLLTKVKALAPLVAIFRMLDADPAEPETLAKLADRVRQLRAVTLPPIEQPGTIYQLVSRYSAVSRLQNSLGADPRTVPFSKVQQAVQRKVDSVVSQLPQTVQVSQGQLTGMVARQPNPSQLLTPAVIDQAQALPPAVLDRMKWQVPPFEQLAMLTTAQPVAMLASLLQATGVDAVRTSPCGQTCDAGSASRAA